ncbi:MAG: MFS transporter [Rhodospirillaceae bacterium]|nr:MFS transporter [Rhodospirillaceae bacterium]MBT5180120.1 MFS transporter [Rhodospirillaceae bacterium]
MSFGRDKRNVLVLSICQALFNSGRGLMFLAATLVGANMLGENLIFVTAPITIMLVGTASGTLPAAHLMRLFGRKVGFVIGSVIGAGGCWICYTSLPDNNFLLFNVGMFFYGIYSGFSQQYRFAVADAAPDNFKAKAISLVLAASVVGAVVGPETAKVTRNLFVDVEFAGSMLALIGLCLATGLIVTFIDIPKLSREEYADKGRPLLDIVAQPTFIVAFIAAAIGYVAMNILMTATPLSMRLGSNFNFNDTALVIEWHIIGMFAPGFFTGHLITRFGHIKVIFAGGLLLLLAVATALNGITLTHFWVAMFLVGAGWNFTFTGGTALLTGVYTPSERNKVQGIYDFTVFSFMALSSLSSGAIFHFLGWKWVNLSALPMVAILLTATIWLAWIRRAAPQTAPVGGIDRLD